MRVTLQVVSGPRAGKRITLSHGQSATFGRTPEADYQFPGDPLMSSRHFAIEVDSQGSRLRDLESRNGTFLDDKRIVERTLTSGAVILAGETRFQVTVAEAAPLTPLPPLPAPTSPLAAPVPPVGLPPPAAADFFPPAQVAFAPLSFPPLNKPSINSPPVNSPPTRQEIASAAPLSATKVAPVRERWRAQASREFEVALDDPDDLVRRNALLAATWQGLGWALDYCRAMAARPAPENWDAHWLLSVLGQPEDLPRVLAIAGTAELGPRRLALLGVYGHPQGMSDLFAALEGAQAELANSAAAAFEKITGVNIRSSNDAAVAPPNTALAACAWQSLKAKSPAAVRLCRGHDISRGMPPEILTMLDLESRWEACLRGRFAKRWEQRPLDLEQLAHALSGGQPL